MADQKRLMSHNRYKKDNVDTVRVTFNVPAELARRLEQLPWGVRANLLRILLDKLLQALERQGSIVIGAILSGQFRLVYEAEEVNKRMESLLPQGGEKNG